MEIKQLNLIYFSPTRTTQKVLESIAAGMDIKAVEHIDLTLPGKSQQEITLMSDSMVLMGAPVYGGRVPEEAIRRFKRLKADNTPAVLVVAYGNREFEDALLELKDLAHDLGFVAVAGGAFIGEHSFATSKIPIANNRPDDMDIQTAMDFGKKIKEKLDRLKSSNDVEELKVPGRFPYEGGALSMAVTPLTEPNTCTVCGTCKTVCPTAAISIEDAVVETETDGCIRCCACIKNCPTDSRFWEDAKMKQITAWLHENCSVRKEPQVFGVALKK